MNAIQSTLSTALAGNPCVVGFTIALTSALLLSADPLFIRFAEVASADATFLFGLFTALSMSGLLQFTDKRGVVGAVKASGWPLLITALLMVGSASSMVFSVLHTSIANSTLIRGATPAMAAVISWLVLGEVAKRSTWLAMAGVMLGIAIVVSGSLANGQSGHWQGDLVALVSVLCLGLMFTLMRKYQQISRLANVGLGGLFIALLMLPFADPASYSLETWLIMAAMGLFSAPLGRVLSLVATRYITAAEVSLSMMLTTVLSPLWAYLVFAERPSLNSLLGGALIISTMLIYTLSQLRSHK
ncbi:DMT family transporter [Aliagarivorans marinus]|uniref:DMT family transporter n=1 Tax=Aliagarivorans marinus TaxID=561965 RepID=UPI0004176164|nr:DMT family transporter [Aliagarivorans marinus]